MQAGIPQAHGLIQSMNRERGKYLVDLIPGTACLFYSRKQYRFLVKIAHYEFFYSHYILAFSHELRAASTKLSKPIILYIIYQLVAHSLRLVAFPYAP